METLQGLSAAELSSADGRKWRSAYSDPASTKREGLDSIVWPEEIILVEKKSKLGMNLAGRNHHCRRKEQAGDESERKKSSLWKKRASWG